MQGDDHGVVGGKGCCCESKRRGMDWDSDITEGKEEVQKRTPSCSWGPMMTLVALASALEKNCTKKQIPSLLLWEPESSLHIKKLLKNWEKFWRLENLCSSASVGGFGCHLHSLLGSWVVAAWRIQSLRKLKEQMNLESPNLSTGGVFSNKETKSGLHSSWPNLIW